MWEDEVLKWQMLFGNEWVRRVDLEDKGVGGNIIPVGLYERNHPSEFYRLKPLEEREVIIGAWERQNAIKERIQNEQIRKSKTR